MKLIRCPQLVTITLLALAMLSIVSPARAGFGHWPFKCVKDVPGLPCFFYCQDPPPATTYPLGREYAPAVYSCPPKFDRFGQPIGPCPTETVPPCPTCHGQHHH